MIPSDIQQQLNDQIQTRETFSKRFATIPGQRREIRVKWAEFVDAVRADDNPAAAYRAYRAKADSVRKLVKALDFTRSMSRDAYRRVIHSAINDINARLLAATVYDGGLGTTVEAPHRTAEERDEMIRDALADASELAERIGFDDFQAPQPTPEARHTPIHLTGLYFSEVVPDLPRVETSITIHEPYSAALDQAQSELLRAA